MQRVERHTLEAFIEPNKWLRAWARGGRLLWDDLYRERACSADEVLKCPGKQALGHGGGWRVEGVTSDWARCRSPDVSFL